MKTITLILSITTLLFGVITFGTGIAGVDAGRIALGILELFFGALGVLFYKLME